MGINDLVRVWIQLDKHLEDELASCKGVLLRTCKHTQHYSCHSWYDYFWLPLVPLAFSSASLLTGTGQHKGENTHHESSGGCRQDSRPPGFKSGEARWNAWRTEEMSRKFFLHISQPTSCLYHLLPDPRDNSVISRLRTYKKYPRVFTRTKRYCSFIHYALNHYQNSTSNS